MRDEHQGIIPPQNLEAEQSCLGSMMLEQDALTKGVALLTATDFYRPAHQIVFSALVALLRNDLPCDLITTQEELRSRGKLEDCGGTEYLMALVESVPTAAHVEHYAKIVAKKAQLRRLIAAGTEIIASAQAEEEDAADKFMRKAVELSSGQSRSMRQGTDVLTEVWKRFEGYREGKGGVGIPFGIHDLDQMTHGVRSGELVLIGGRPSQGKSVLLQHLLLSAAEKGCNPLLFTYEMTAEEMLERVACMEARIDSNDARFGRMSDDDWYRLSEAYANLTNINFLVDDLPCPLTRLCARARSAAVTDKIGLILIDYLQLVECDAKAGNRDERLSIIGQTLKNLAKELAVPIVVPTQLSRAVEKRDKGEREPILSDLRDGGNQEGHADKVILIHNPLPTNYNTGDKLTGRGAKMIVAKNRGGRTGEVGVWFTPYWTRFDGYHGQDCDV